MCYNVTSDPFLGKICVFPVTDGRPRLNNYAYIGLFAILGIAFAVVTMWMSSALRPTYKPTGGKAEPYECGETPFGNAWKQFKIGYYIYALVFVVFDVEAIFIFPWAKELLHLKGAGLGIYAFVEMLVFIAILFVGLLYAWRKGVLRWE